MRVCVCVAAVLALLAVCLPVIADAASSSPLSASARTHVLSVLSSSRGAAGGWESSAETSAALAAYAALGETAPASNAAASCAPLQKDLLGAVRGNKLAAASHALVAAAVLQCASFTVPAPQLQAMLQTALHTRASVEDISLAARAVFALSALPSAQLPLSTFEASWRGLDSTLLGLLEEDGTVRSSAEDDEGSAYHAGLALQVLGELAAKVPSAVDAAVVRQFADKAPALVASGISGEQIDYSLGAPADVTPLQALAAVLDGVNALSQVSKSPVELKKAQVTALGDYAVRHAYVASARDAAALASCLRFISRNSVFVPLYVSAVESTAPGLRVRVSNILGAPATKVNVLVDSARSVAPTAGATIKDLAFQPASDSKDGTEYVLTEAGARAWAAAKPGVYELKLSVAPKGGEAAGYGASSGAQYAAQSGLTLTRKVTVARDALLQGARVEVSISDAAKLAKDEKSSSAQFPAGVSALSPAPTLDASKHLHVTLRLGAKAPLRPSAVFLQLSSATSRDALFVLRPAAGSDSEGVYTLKLALGSSELIDSLSGAGTYALTLLAGDALAASQARWSLGHATLALPSPATPAGASSPDQLDAFFAPRPLIAHTFRAPDARSSGFVATLFTLLTMAPFGALLLVLARSGALSIQLPTQAGELLHALVFQASILALLFSFALYWLKLNIFQALALLAACGAVALFSGTGALRMRHQRSQREAKGHAE